MQKFLRILRVVQDVLLYEVVHTRATTPTLSPVLRQDLVAYKRVTPPPWIPQLVADRIIRHRAASPH